MQATPTTPSSVTPSHPSQHDGKPAAAAGLRRCHASFSSAQSISGFAGPHHVSLVSPSSTNSQLSLYSASASAQPSHGGVQPLSPTATPSPVSTAAHTRRGSHLMPHSPSLAHPTESPSTQLQALIHEGVPMRMYEWDVEAQRAAAPWSSPSSTPSVCVRPIVLFLSGWGRSASLFFYDRSPSMHGDWSAPITEEERESWRLQWRGWQQQQQRRSDQSGDEAATNPTSPPPPPPLDSGQCIPLRWVTNFLLRKKSSILRAIPSSMLDPNCCFALVHTGGTAPSSSTSAPIPASSPDSDPHAHTLNLEAASGQTCKLVKDALILALTTTGKAVVKAGPASLPVPTHPAALAEAKASPSAAVPSTPASAGADAPDMTLLMRGVRCMLYSFSSTSTPSSSSIAASVRLQEVLLRFLPPTSPTTPLPSRTSTRIDRPGALTYIVLSEAYDAQPPTPTPSPPVLPLRSLKQMQLGRENAQLKALDRLHPSSLPVSFRAPSMNQIVNLLLNPAACLSIIFRTGHTLHVEILGPGPPNGAAGSNTPVRSSSSSSSDNNDANPLIAGGLVDPARDSLRDEYVSNIHRLMMDFTSEEKARKRRMSQQGSATPSTPASMVSSTPLSPGPAALPSPSPSPAVASHQRPSNRVSSSPLTAPLSNAAAVAAVPSTQGPIVHSASVTPAPNPVDDGGECPHPSLLHGVPLSIHLHADSADILPSHANHSIHSIPVSVWLTELQPTMFALVYASRKEDEFEFGHPPPLPSSPTFPPSTQRLTLRSVRRLLAGKQTSLFNCFDPSVMALPADHCLSIVGKTSEWNLSCESLASRDAFMLHLHHALLRLRRPSVHSNTATPTTNTPTSTSTSGESRGHPPSDRRHSSSSSSSSHSLSPLPPTLHHSSRSPPSSAPPSCHSSSIPSYPPIASAPDEPFLSHGLPCRIFHWKAHGRPSSPNPAVIWDSKSTSALSSHSDSLVTISAFMFFESVPVTHATLAIAPGFLFFVPIPSGTSAVTLTRPPPDAVPAWRCLPLNHQKAIVAGKDGTIWTHPSLTHYAEECCLTIRFSPLHSSSLDSQGVALLSEWPIAFDTRQQRDAFIQGVRTIIVRYTSERNKIRPTSPATSTSTSLAGAQTSPLTTPTSAPPSLSQSQSARIHSVPRSASDVGEQRDGDRDRSSIDRNAHQPLSPTEEGEEEEGDGETMSTMIMVHSPIHTFSGDASGTCLIHSVGDTYSPSPSPDRSPASTTLHTPSPAPRIHTPLSSAMAAVSMNPSISPPPPQSSPSDSPMHVDSNVADPASARVAAAEARQVAQQEEAVRAATLVSAGQHFTMFQRNAISGELECVEVLVWFQPSFGEETPGSLYWSPLDLTRVNNAQSQVQLQMQVRVPDTRRKFLLTSIRQMRAGKESDVLRAAIARGLAEERCLVLAGTDVTLHMAAPTQQVRDAWMRAIHAIVVQHGMRATEEKRHSQASGVSPSSPSSTSSSTAQSPASTMSRSRAGSGSVGVGVGVGVGDRIHALSSSSGSFWSSSAARTLSFMDPTSFFDLQAKIGSGSYGSVYRAIDKRDGSDVAVKVIPFSGIDSSKLRNEIRLLRACSSPYIIAYRGAFQRNDHLWIVMEYCIGGSLSDMMAVCQHTFSENQISVIMRQALQGLKYLHTRTAEKKIIIHRDIKGGNILVNDSGICKLADFGVSGQLDDVLGKHRTVIGTPHWMSPEVLQSDSYNELVDIWSLGITTYELSVGHPPHAELHSLRAALKIPLVDPPSLPHPERYSPELHSFLRCCLVKDYTRRPPAADLLKHPFIANNHCSTHILIDMVKKTKAARQAREAEEQANNQDPLLQHNKQR